jgi:hypothetical protein
MGFQDVRRFFGNFRYRAAHLHVRFFLEDMRERRDILECSRSGGATIILIRTQRVLAFAFYQ